MSKLRLKRFLGSCLPEWSGPNWLAPKFDASFSPPSPLTVSPSVARHELFPFMERGTSHSRLLHDRLVSCVPSFPMLLVISESRHAVRRDSLLSGGIVANCRRRAEIASTFLYLLLISVFVSCDRSLSNCGDGSSEGRPEHIFPPRSPTNLSVRFRPAARPCFGRQRLSYPEVPGSLSPVHFDLFR